MCKKINNNNNKIPKNVKPFQGILKKLLEKYIEEKPFSR